VEGERGGEVGSTIDKYNKSSKTKIPTFTEYAAAHGYLNLVKWAIDYGYLPKEMCSYAAAGMALQIK
jgi:hypothetical protein